MRRPCNHIRTSVKGKKFRVNAHIPKKYKVKIPARTRQVFDAMTTNKKLRDYEYGGDMDFERRGKEAQLEQFTTNIGTAGYVDLPVDKDKEMRWHTHPKRDLPIFSTGDMQGIIDSSQQGEILFQDGKAVTLLKPKKVKKTFLPEYDRQLKKEIRSDNDKATAVNNLKKVLVKHNFKVKTYGKNKPIIVELNEVH